MLPMYISRYKLNDVKDFKCIYSLRLYKLFAQFQGIGSHEITIDELRLLLDLDKKYLLYAEFKRCVIEKSINEINAHSNLTVKFNEQRKGRKVIAIQFFFVTKIKKLPKNKIDQQKATILKTSTEEREILIEKFANSRKRFGDVAVIPEEFVSILKQQGRW
jgi:plasmid replication initiation protein